MKRTSCLSGSSFDVRPFKGRKLAEKFIVTTNRKKSKLLMAISWGLNCNPHSLLHQFGLINLLEHIEDTWSGISFFHKVKEFL
ncbi:hypothetical protein ACQKKK_19975 [Peribacillus sp. NPDC006672]|uniref:hypothetical protein n=1 Tax=Peribacillus sp. NPDC006672 TaxID=3390606 RepID=UPI003D0345DB